MHTAFWLGYNFNVLCAHDIRTFCRRRIPGLMFVCAHYQYLSTVSCRGGNKQKKEGGKRNKRGKHRYDTNTISLKLLPYFDFIRFFICFVMKFKGAKSPLFVLKVKRNWNLWRNFNVLKTFSLYMHFGVISFSVQSQTYFGGNFW